MNDVRRELHQRATPSGSGPRHGCLAPVAGWAADARFASLCETMARVRQTAAFLGLAQLERLGRTIAALLERVRAGESALVAAMMDDVASGVDSMHDRLCELRETGRVPVADDDELLARLSRWRFPQLAPMLDRPTVDRRTPSAVVPLDAIGTRLDGLVERAGALAAVASDLERLTRRGESEIFVKPG